MKCVRRWEVSQNGRFSLLPHRQSASRVSSAGASQLEHHVLRQDAPALTSLRSITSLMTATESMTTMTLGARPASSA